MHFDDGTDPWVESDNTVKVFDFGLSYLRSSSTTLWSKFYIVFILLVIRF